MLLNRLHDHILDKCEMKQSQIKAIEILMDRALPRLQSTEIRGTLELQTVVVVPAVSQCSKDWTESLRLVEQTPNAPDKAE
jgi:hypothetical protein